LATTGLFGYAFAPSWGWLLAAALTMGLSFGLVGGSLNTYFATRYGAQELNWLHASFGIGATIGPLVMSGVLNADRSWQNGYLLVSVIFSLVTLMVAFSWRTWQAESAAITVEQPQSQRQGNGRTLRLPLVWVGLWVFFLYVGTETTAGQWSYTLFTESRHVAETVASAWVSVFWGSLTAGRLLMGMVVSRLGNGRVMRFSLAGVLLATLLIWLPVQSVSFFGLALMGFAAAPIFPLLTADTPRRVGAAHAANAVGFQIGASSMGLAVQPGIAGWLADEMGLEVIGPYMVLMALAMWVSYEIMDKMPVQTLVNRQSEVVGD
ncbi:MAG: MFS transporter, partial [Ardenticatenaceae bacterium]|nr:MFS transporter [Ardenticatenaceae bacterium]